jgi:hypothetical protein
MQNTVWLSLLLTILVHTSTQQQPACPDVQLPLKELTEAIQSLCSSSTTVPPVIVTSEPPVVQPQQCDCGRVVNWTSVSMTVIGQSTLQHTGTITYDIPSLIPSSAKEVLVLVSVRVGYTSPSDLGHYIKIYTEENSQQYEQYIYLYSYRQNAYNTNSDNMWFPMTSGRQVFMKLSSSHTGNLRLILHAIGYR